MSQRPRSRAGICVIVDQRRCERRAVLLLLVMSWLAAAAPIRAQPIDDDPRTHALDRIRGAPLEADGFAELATVLFRSGEITRAAAAAGEAVRLEPDGASYHRLLGYLQAANGNVSAAEAAFRRAAELAPDARTPLADFHLAQAWGEYQDALRRNPTDISIAERLRGIAALAELSPELRSLVNAPGTRQPAPAGDLVPPIGLSDEAPYALIIEKRSQTARLYGRGVAGDIALLQTFPCSTGQETGTKSRRGDRRTPDGAYVITDLLPGDDLPDAYGALALPLSYPNAWDRRQHHGGNGIWLHGSDRLGAPFTPRETRGCVLLRNDDLRALAGVVSPAVTPVLITEDISYRPAAEWRAITAALAQAIAADHLLAVAATSDYIVALHREGATVVRDFLQPDSPWSVVASERSQPIAGDVWQQRLAELAPDPHATLLSVRIVDQPAPAAVVIETSSPVVPRDFRPEVPDRLYVDLPGVRQGPLPLVVPGAGSWIREVRVAASTLDPPTTRVEIAFQQPEPADYRIANDGNRVVVSFGVH